jgi:peptidoglycan/xylan/chitin deacetylase (PgdA/CDA1 family)
MSEVRTGVGTKIALTIDTEERSCPADLRNPLRQLDVLAGEGVPATFFVQGRWAAAHPEVARRIADEGHLLGNHTYHHVPLSMMTDEGIRHTVLRGEEAVRQCTGARLRPWFRCPYGDGENNLRVLRVLADIGYRNVGWDVDPTDWAPGVSPTEVVDAVLDGCRGGWGEARVLLHSWPDVSAVALPLLIARLRETGVRFVRLDELADATAPGRTTARDEGDGDGA